MRVRDPGGGAPGARLVKAPGAFTLAEVLIAVFILALIMGTVTGTFTGVISGARDAQRRSDLHQTGRAVLDMIARDVRCMFDQGSAGGETYFKGHTVPEGGGPGSAMSFLTTNTLAMGKRPGPFVSEVGYRVERNDDGLLSLWRRAEVPPGAPFDEGGTDVPVCRIVEGFKLEFMYLDAEEESSTESLPDAVLVDLTLDLEGEKERFVTMVRPVVAGAVLEEGEG